MYCTALATVATKGTSRAEFSRAAAIRPIPAPIPAQMSVPTMSTRASPLWALIKSRIASAATTPENPVVAATDRSIPPEMITKVSPTASKINEAKIVSRTAFTAAELAEDIRQAAAGRQRLIVGIVGAPGAGNSTLAAQLDALLGYDAVLVPMDGFHLSNRVLADLGRQQRKGPPDTFAACGYVALLRRLRQQTDDVVYAPTFRRDLEEPIAASVAVSRQAPIVITEGNYLLLDTQPWSEVREVLDLAWFLEVDHDTRIDRLAARHHAYDKTLQAARDRAEGSDERNAILLPR